ncbi:hypothetical protein WMY93_031747 [Mugilogobius chulae]|uniref:Uncharacterized protein n=1 Tax=Mugilogobius chulae TaxID=88201 RepID=A0AAW0MFC8_9GOBI
MITLLLVHQQDFTCFWKVDSLLLNCSDEAPECLGCQCVCEFSVTLFFGELVLYLTSHFEHNELAYDLPILANEPKNERQQDSPGQALYRSVVSEQGLHLRPENVTESKRETFTQRKTERRGGGRERKKERGREKGEEEREGRERKREGERRGEEEKGRRERITDRLTYLLIDSEQ